MTRSINFIAKQYIAKHSKHLLSCLFEQNEAYITFLANKYKIYNLSWEDNYQEVCLGVIRAIHTYTGKTAFTTWCDIVVCHHMGGLKRKYIVRKDFINAVSLNKNVPRDSKMTLMDQLVGQEKTENDYADLSSVISHLPTKQKHIAKLLSEGLTQTEIAKEIGVSQPQVHRIVVKIRKQIKQFYSGVDA